MQNDDFEIRIKHKDGTWETLGVESQRGILPQKPQASASESGSERLSFELRRQPGFNYPDLAPFTPVEYWVGGKKVWAGRLIESPTRDGDEYVINVQAEGLPAVLDDDTFKRLYVHARISEWRDWREYLWANLKKFVTAWDVETGSALSFKLEEGKVIAADKLAGVWLDGGYEGAIKRIVLTYNNSALDAQLEIHASDELPFSFDESEANVLGNLNTAHENELNDTVTKRLTLTTARRYVALVVRPDAHTAVEDEWVQIKSIQCFGDSAWEDDDASVLKASDVVRDAISYTSSQISESTELIDDTSFDLPDLAFTEQGLSPREVINGVNTFHGWRTGVDVDGRVIFQPQESAPELEIGEWSGAEFSAASENSGEDIYNVGSIEATAVDGEPLTITRTSDTDGTARVQDVVSPAPDNPSFSANKDNWTLVPASRQFPDSHPDVIASRANVVAHYRFLDDSAMTDETGSHDGTYGVTPATLIDGPILGEAQPHAFNAGGGTGWVPEAAGSIPDAPALRPDGTWAVEFWHRMQPTAVHGNFSEILRKGNPSTDGWHAYIAYADTNRLEIEYKGLGIIVSENLASEDWTHFVIQRDAADAFQVYINGEKVVESTIPDPSTGNTDPVKVLPSNTWSLDSDIAGLVFYSDALTDAEVEESHGASAGGISRVQEEYDTSPASGLWRKGQGWAQSYLKTTFTGSWRAGTHYRVSMRLKALSGTTAKVRMLLGSGGDTGEATVTVSDSWETKFVSWIPRTSLSSGVTLRYEIVGGTATGLRIDSLKVQTVTSNPLDSRGIRRGKSIPVQNAMLTPEAADQILKIWLRQHTSTALRGSIKVDGVGAVRRVLTCEPLHPAELLLHVGKQIRLSHRTNPDDGSVGRDATIVSVSYDHEERAATLELDNRRNTLEVLLNRLALISG